MKSTTITIILQDDLEMVFDPFVQSPDPFPRRCTNYCSFMTCVVSVVGLRIEIMCAPSLKMTNPFVLIHTLLTL